MIPHRLVRRFRPTGAAVLVGGTAAAAAPRVVATIPPVAALAADVMRGVAEPRLLLPPGASPHDYQMRPSDARALSEADVVLWIGPELETFLADPLATLAPGARRVALLHADGVVHLEMREGGAWEPHEHGEHDHEDHADKDHDHEGHDHKEHADKDHDHEDHDHAAHGHDDEAVDAHAWLDPANARAMARAIHGALTTADPANAARYTANLAGLDAALAALDGELAARLKPVAERPYVVFHDAFQYLERHYRLNGVGSVTLTPDREPGARRIAELRERIRSLGAVCVFAEPQFQPRLVDTLAEGLDVSRDTLDPLGTTADAAAGGYAQLMRRNADAFVRCLSPTG